MLELCRVAKFYGPKIVLKEISCTFAAGSVNLMVGGNGAGKSTLMRIMAGLAQPSSGTVKRREDAAVAYLGHATFLYPGLTAFENLAFWREAQGLARNNATVEAALERVELTAHAHERAGIFSRGMAQRLNLARVLMAAPDLLLLDEPGTGLDTPSLTLLRREVVEAAQGGACVVLISHDLAGDACLAHRLLALAGRTLAYDGPPADFLGFSQQHRHGHNPVAGTAADYISDHAADHVPDHAATAPANTQAPAQSKGQAC